METLSVKFDLLERITYIYCIMPYYDYAYGAAKVIKGLSRKTRKTWINNQETIIKMFKKQTITINCKHQKIDQNTLKTLKKDDRFKLFNFDIYLDYENKKQVKMVYTLLDEIPDLEISKIDIVN